MANFNLVVDTSSFKPFSYDEMIRPLLLYKQEEEARLQAYLDLQERASTLEDLAASEKDIEAYNTYSTYKNRLREIADDMARNGLTRQNSQVFNLRRLYVNDIKPLNDLLKKRNDLIRELRERDKGDGTNIYSIDYSNMSLADMQKNPVHTYNTLNGNAVRAISAEVFEKLADQIMESPERTSILGGQYFEEKVQRGYTLDQIINELLGTKTGSKLFETKLKILSSLNMDKKGFTPEDLKRIAQFVDMGAMAALGRTEYNHINNKNFIDPGTRENILSSRQSRAQSAAEFNFKYKTENGKIIGINPAYKEAYSSRDNTSPVARPGSYLDYYTNGKSDNFAKVSNGAVTADKVPSSVKQVYGNIDGVSYYQILDSKGNIIGYRVVVPPGTLSATNGVDDSQGE